MFCRLLKRIGKRAIAIHNSRQERTAVGDDKLGFVILLFALTFTGTFALSHKKEEARKLPLQFSVAPVLIKASISAK